MPTAKKLPSGSWRCQVYSHTEDILQPDGTIKQKRVYRSFTSDVPGSKGKRLAEQMAADFAAGKEQLLPRVRHAGQRGGAPVHRQQGRRSLAEHPPRV